MATQIALIVTALLVAAALTVRRWHDNRTDPHRGLAVVDVRTARLALIMVSRLERTSTDDATAYRHLKAVEVWAGPERTAGTRRHRANAAALYHAAGAGLVALHLPTDFKLSPEGARRGHTHLRTGGTTDDLFEVVCSDARGVIGDAFSSLPRRGRIA
jgi:hypothetical protein